MRSDKIKEALVNSIHEAAPILGTALLLNALLSKQWLFALIVAIGIGAYVYIDKNWLRPWSDPSPASQFPMPGRLIAMAVHNRFSIYFGIMATCGTGFWNILVHVIIISILEAIVDYVPWMQQWQGGYDPNARRHRRRRH